MWGAGLQPLEKVPEAGQKEGQSCWLFQSLHCTHPINQTGRCSKLITVRLNGFLTGVMPVPWSFASSHLFPGALTKSFFFPVLFVMWVDKAPAPGQSDRESNSEYLCCTVPSAKWGRDWGNYSKPIRVGLQSPSPRRIKKDLLVSTELLQLAAVAGSPATNHLSEEDYYFN